MFYWHLSADIIKPFLVVWWAIKEITSHLANSVSVWFYLQFFVFFYTILTINYIITKIRIKAIKSGKILIKSTWFISAFIVQWISDSSTFDLRKFFDLRKNFTVPKILAHKMFDLRKISRTPFFDLREKNQAFWGKKGNIWQKNTQT